MFRKCRRVFKYLLKTHWKSPVSSAFLIFRGLENFVKGHSLSHFPCVICRKSKKAQETLDKYISRYISIFSCFGSVFSPSRPYGLYCDLLKSGVPRRGQRAARSRWDNTSRLYIICPKKHRGYITQHSGELFLHRCESPVKAY